MVRVLASQQCSPGSSSELGIPASTCSFSPFLWALCSFFFVCLFVFCFLSFHKNKHCSIQIHARIQWPLLCHRKTVYGLPQKFSLVSCFDLRDNSAVNSQSWLSVNTFLTDTPKHGTLSSIFSIVLRIHKDTFA